MSGSVASAWRQRQQAGNKRQPSEVCSCWFPTRQPRVQYGDRESNMVTGTAMLDSPSPCWAPMRHVGVPVAVLDSRSPCWAPASAMSESPRKPSDQTRPMCIYGDASRRLDASV